MLERLRDFLRGWLNISPARPVMEPTQSGLSLTEAVEQYQASLTQLTPEPQSLLAVLLARSEVEIARRQAAAPTAVQVQQLVALDAQLRQVSSDQLESLPAWRHTLSPPEAAWWWYLDKEAQARQQEIEQREQENDLIWILLTGTLLLFTSTLTLEIIKRLWADAPDMSAILGTLLMLLLTGSPFTKRGQELATLVFKRLPWLTPRYRAEAMAAMAFLAFASILLIWLFVRPWWATKYNNWGMAALLDGKVTTAQNYFQRAVALDPEQVVAYHNLADVYARIGQPQEATKWYQQAIARDANFGPAYASLSRLLNEQSQFDEAARLALAGLRSENEIYQPEIALIVRYHLLSNLGWACFGQDQYKRAQDMLETAVSLETELKTLEAQYGQLRQATPHFFLAQIYEQQKMPEESIAHWQEALRYLNAENWDHREWLDVVQDKLSNP